MVPTPEPNPTVDPEPDNLVELGCYPDAVDGFHHGLVILAMGRACWLVPSERGFRLLAEPRDLEEVNRQLRCFDRESRRWPPPPIEPAAVPYRIDLLTPVVWAISVLGCYWAEIEHPSWIDAGLLDTRAVFSKHEWWRPFTALFLHADASHVASNGIIGIILFSAVTTTFGRLRGWLLVGLAAVAGNFAVAALNYPGPYRSLGASTAIFAGVGLLTGRGIRLVVRARQHRRWQAVLTPIVAGGTILALYGAGGVQIDVLAHVSGFITGIAVGFAGVRLATTAPSIPPAPPP